MRIRASVVKNPGFCETNTQKNCHEQKNLRTPSHPSFAYLRICVTEQQNHSLNKRTRGRGLERPGDGLAALFLEGVFCRIFGRGDRIEVVICDRAGELDRTALVDDINNQQHHNQLMYARAGAGMPGG